MRFADMAADKLVGKDRNEIAYLLQTWLMPVIIRRCAELHNEYEDADVIDDAPINWSRALEPLR